MQNRVYFFNLFSFIRICAIVIGMTATHSLQGALDPEQKDPGENPVTLDINGYYPLSGNSSIDVQSYELHFSDINYSAETISASAVISIRAVSNLTAATGICLDFAPPGGNVSSISSLTVDGASCPFTLETCAGGSAGNYETYLKITPVATITAGTTFSVALSWSGHPNEESTGYGDGWGMDFRTSPDVVTTMNQPNSAHLWFPCNDMPEDKATCDVYGTVDLDQWAISIGELMGVATNGSERTFHWQTGFNVSPYLIAFNAGDYIHVPDVGGAPVPVEAWYYSGSYSSWESGAENARDFLNTYTNLFGPYPFEKFAHVQFWNTGAAYMEHQTITSMKDNSTQYTAHELAHQWWGDYVTCETWDDLWLNEGFAVYSEDLYSRGRSRRDELGEALPNRENLNWSRKLNDPGYNTINDLFSSSLTYHRGAWTLHHIRSYLGEDKFWPAILHYKDECADGTANTEQFRDYLAESAFEEQAGQESFKAFFDRYLEDAQPELNVNWHARTLNGHTHICMFNSRDDGFECGDVIVSKVNFTDGTDQTVFHRFTTNESASAVIISNKTFASISVDEYGDFPYKSATDLSVSGDSSTTDSDNDSLPDQWELATMGTTENSETDDPDGDGIDNAAEFANGTLPGVVTVNGSTPEESFSCYDSFSGNESGWPDGSSWGGNLTVTVNSGVTPLIYSNEFVYVNGGDTAISITNNVSGSTSHSFSRSIQEQTNTFYMSFLARHNVTPSGWYDYLALGRKVSDNDSGVGLGRINNTSSAGGAFINDGMTYSPFSTAAQAGETFFVVAKYTWDENSSAFTGLTAYLNPTSATEENAAESVSVSGSVNASFDSADFQYFGSADAEFDEIRIGHSWADVVPANTQTVNEASLTIILSYDTSVQNTQHWGIVENNSTNWYESEESVALDPATYHIVYTDSFQSEKPSEENVTIAEGEILNLTRSYNQAAAMLWQDYTGNAFSITNLGHSQSATNGNGLLAQYFGVYPELQTVEDARLNSNISISDTADLIGSLDRSDRPQDETWVYDWTSLNPTLHTNTTDWGESDWIGLHTPSRGFDLQGAYAPGGDDHPYNSKTDHTDPDNNATLNDYYPSGGEYYDLEAMYFDNDSDYFYISIIASAPFSNSWINADGTLCHDLGVPDKLSSLTNSVVPPGDIAFDFGLNDPISEDGDTFSYDFGIDLTHEVRDSSQWYSITHTYSNSASSTSTFSYDRPSIRDLDAGTSLYRTENTDWFLALDSGAAIGAGGERSNFDPEYTSSSASYKGEVQSSVYRLNFPSGQLENDLPTYVYEFIIPRALFCGAETNRNYMKIRFLPTTCRNDGNSDDHVFYLDAAVLDEPQTGALGNRAWFDKNGNGIQDDSENNLGITNVQVVAVSKSTGAAYTNHTDSQGYYLFDNMPEGYYNVYFDGPEDYDITVYNSDYTERGHYVDSATSAIKNVYVTANATNLNADIGFNTVPLSTEIDIQAYDSGNGIMIEISTVNENGNNDIEIYAKIKGKWQLVAVVPSEQIIGFGSNTYSVEATGLEVGKNYKFKIIDECGHIFESGSIKVEKIKLKAVKTKLTPEYFTMTFDSDSTTWYEVQYCNSLSGNAQWKTEYVQVIHSTFPDGVSDFYLTIQGAPEGQTTVRIPHNHKKAFYKIVEVAEE